MGAEVKVANDINQMTSIVEYNSLSADFVFSGGWYAAQRLLSLICTTPQADNALNKPDLK